MKYINIYPDTFEKSINTLDEFEIENILDLFDVEYDENWCSNLEEKLYDIGNGNPDYIIINNKKYVFCLTHFQSTTICIYYLPDYLTEIGNKLIEDFDSNIKSFKKTLISPLNGIQYLVGGFLYKYFEKV